MHLRKCLLLPLLSLALFACKKSEKERLLDHVETYKEDTFGDSSKKSENLVYELDRHGCKVKFIVIPNSSVDHWSLTLEDECTSYSQESIDAMNALLEKIFKAYSFTKLESMQTCKTPMKLLWAERMALHSFASKKWTGKTKHLGKPIEEFYTELFNKKNVAKELVDFMQAHHLQSVLYTVEGVSTVPAKMVPFTKPHPGLSRSNKRVLLDAGCFYFNVFPT